MTRVLEAVFTPALGRCVYLRPDTNDRAVWSDTFTGLYHVPPDSMPPPRTVLDLGANVGLTAAHYLALWPGADVLAVEMDAANAALLPLNAPGVRQAVYAVVGANPGLAFYEVGANSDGYAIGADPNSPFSRVVRRKTLRQVILQGFGDAGVDFVKMDVEGAEWEILNEASGWAPLVRHLLVELHGGSLVKHAIALLRKAGFHAGPHRPHPQAVFAHR